MTSQSKDLFTNRSTTQEFLFSHLEDRIENDNVQKRSDSGDDTVSAPLHAKFPEMLDRQGVLHTIDTDMKSVPSLVAIAIEIVWQGESIADQDPTTVLTKENVMPMADLCRTHNGTLARIGHNRFACVFPNLSETKGLSLAESLFPFFPETGKSRIIIGLAVYPTINYTRNQIVANSEKALDHAEFFGPGAVTLFDAVSLNISGDRRYQNGDIEGAIDEFTKGLQLDPTDSNLHNSLGVCHGVLKNFDSALSAFENAIWLAPDEIMAIYNKGYTLLAKGKRESALECFFDAYRREPDVFEVVFHIGKMLMDSGDLEKARSFLEKAAKINNRSGPALKSLGSCLEQLGSIKEAIQAYKNIVKINPADTEALSTLGSLYVRLGESLDVAAVLCEQSVHLSPENGLFRQRLGSAYQNLGKLEQAMAEFEQAQALGHESRLEMERIQALMMEAKAS